MSQYDSRSDSPLHRPPLTRSQLLNRAWPWALFWAANVVLLWHVLAAANLVYHGRALPLSTWLVSAPITFLLVLAVLFAGRLLWLSRPLQDRSFTVVGFTATFFGLAVLIVFLGSLGYETIQWFNTVPRLVEEKSEAYREKMRVFGELTGKERKRLEDERDDAIKLAETEEEKKEIRATYDKEVIPQIMKEFTELTIKEMKVETAAAIREYTSPPAVFWHYLTSGPGRDPVDSGLAFAIMGTVWVAIITMALSVPIGVGTALYLEEYRSRGWLGRVIQININNLAGVPSVVYGILGATVFVEWIFKPISTIYPWVSARNLLGGGATLAALTLPMVIVSAQEAIRAVPPSIRHGAYALGATQWQVIWRQVLPMASSGILTGTILSVSRAIGEAAPLVLFGALLHVDTVPGPFTRFTVIPIQIFAWSSEPNDVSRLNAALACVVLMVVLLMLNGFAIYLRQRSQRNMRV